MKLINLEGKKGFKVFSSLGEKFYNGNPHYHGTEASIEKLLLLGPTAFHVHATVYYYAVEDEKAEAKSGSKVSTELIIIIAGAVVIVGGIVFFLLKKKK